MRTIRFYNALITPFKKNKKIDFKKFKLIIKDLDKTHDGFIIAGSTGEGLSLSLCEKKRLIRHARKVTSKKIYLAITNPNTYQVISEVRKCEFLNIDGFLVTTPMYYQAPQEGIYYHFAKIAQNTHHDIILYNVPTRTISNIDIKTIIRLSKIKNIIGIKECMGLNKILEIKKSTNMLVFSGNDKEYISIKHFDGLISVFSCFFINEFKKGPSSFLDQKIEHLQKYNNPMVVKELLAKKYGKMYFRLPLINLHENVINELYNELN